MKMKFVYAALCCIMASPGNLTTVSAAEIQIAGANGSCTCVGEVSPAIQSLPGRSAGSPEALRQSARAEVETDFRSTQDIICLARNTRPEVKAALAVGVLDAQNTIGFSDPAAADQIITWVGCADEAFQSAYFGAQARMSAQVDNILVPRSMGGGFSGGVVSPSKP
jgi:hypothetical protein